MEELEAELESNQQTLKEKQTLMAREATTLENDVEALKTELSNNQEILDKLANDRIAEESKAKKAAVEVANRKDLEKQIVEQTKETATSSSKSDNNSTEVVEEKPVTEPTAPVVTPEPTVPESSNGGAVLNMVATAYSYTQPGLSFYTATGIDLRQNSRVIAVDPSVIPLGSLVEVSGYGMAIAGDTGGDIVGNRIDVHFNTIEECRNFGRQNVTVTMK